MLKSQFSVLKSLKSHKIFHLQIMFPLKPPFLHASPSYKPPFNWGFPNFWPQIHLRWRPVSQHAFGASCAHRCRNLQRWPGLCCTLRCRCRCFWWQGQNKKPWNMHVSIHRFAHMEVRRVFFSGASAITISKPQFSGTPGKYFLPQELYEAHSDPTVNVGNNQICDGYGKMTNIGRILDQYMIKCTMNSP